MNISIKGLSDAQLKNLQLHADDLATALNIVANEGNLEDTESNRFMVAKCKNDIVGCTTVLIANLTDVVLMDGE